MNGWMLLGLMCLLAASAADGAEGPPQREIVRRAMRERPGDPWPRGQGHVVLAWPGSPQADKAYHEPGGSFSPAVGSFGISIWVLDPDGKLVTTSDTVPLKDIRQRFYWPWGKGLPAIQTETPHYRALWQSGRHGYDFGVWSLHLARREGTKLRLVVALRSVGPAGGPVHSLEWRAGRLQINGRWTLSIEPPLQAVIVMLGTESPGRDPIHQATRVTSEDGWCYARMELGNGQSGWDLVIEDTKAAAARLLPVATKRATVWVKAPAEPFNDCLQAQIGHLMMGLVGNWTPPGEPTNYPLAWLRDGAYTVAALARAGRLDIAKELAVFFAENDFFGGFGSEADAPGLALWAMEETASRAREPMFDHPPEFDAKLWPHARRKAELILQMLATKEPIRRPYAGPIVPAHRGKKDLDLVCDAARDGLIVGRMDWHRPLLYVNAVSYAGLRSAASLADRLGHAEEAKRWRAAAAELRTAWHRALATGEANNERTLICGLWPTWIVSADQAAYRKLLEKRWPDAAASNIRGTPLWTYFNVAETHQWLLLGDADRVWRTLEWFWDHQASPGLYTWWEGKGEENTFGLWENVRGWVNPPHVTPHYWTAAEMLLLQLDMLAYEDEAAAEPTLVIGAGVPKAWLAKPMSVRDLRTRRGVVDWRWDGQAMVVTVQGEKCKVRLATAFPTEAAVTVGKQ